MTLILAQQIIATKDYAGITQYLLAVATEHVNLGRQQQTAKKTVLKLQKALWN